MMKPLPSSLLVVVIIFTGLLVRLYDLDGESIWVDEGQSIYVANLELAKIIEEISIDNHPPLYSIILHYWIKLFPHTAYFMRLLSAIFGVLAIYLIYKVGEALMDKNTGLIGGFLLSLSVFHIQYSQEIRSYSLVVVLVLLSFLIFIRLLKSKDVYNLVLYIVVNTLLIYTHFLGWIIIFAHNIIYILRFPIKINRFKELILVDLIIFILYIPWLDVMISRISSIQKEFWISLPSWLSIPQTFLIYAGTYTFFGIVMLLIFGFLCLNSIFEYSDRRLKFRHADGEQIYILLIWLWIPILIPFIISFIMKPIFIYRITIGASLAFYLLAAIGMKRISLKTLKTGLLLIIFLLCLGNLSIYYTEINKERWQEVTDYIESNADSGDLLIFHSSFCLDKAFNFYSKRDDLVKKPFPEVGFDVTKNNLNEVSALIKDHDAVWLVLSHGRDKDYLIVQKIEKDFDLIDKKEYISRGFNSHRPYVTIELFHFQRNVN